VGELRSSAARVRPPRASCLSVPAPACPGACLGPGRLLLPGADLRCLPPFLCPCVRRSLEETVALVDGVRMVGAGKWAEIKRLPVASITVPLAGRSPVDLKDKWRNLVRTSAVPPASQPVGYSAGRLPAAWGCQPPVGRPRWATPALRLCPRAQPWTSGPCADAAPPPPPSPRRRRASRACPARC
jgi:hypothetical protein